MKTKNVSVRKGPAKAGKNLKLKLATKTSIVIGTILVISMAILVGSAAASANHRMQTVIDEEFSGIAAQNGMIVQEIIDEASGAARDLQQYMQGAYKQMEEDVKNQPVDENGMKIPFPLKKSAIYNGVMIEKNVEIESYILNTAWSVVGSNPDIIGMGVFFEPSHFDPRIMDYTLYINKQDARNRTAQSYGTYEEYGSMSFYQQAISTQEPVFTPPYEDQGVTMITTAFPIVYNSKAQGVIVADINVDNFVKVRSTHPKYTTMTANIMTSDSTIIYDSTTSEVVGMKASDLMKADYEIMAQEMGAGEPFVVETNKATGSGRVVRFLYPVQAGNETWWSTTGLDKSDLSKDANSLVLLMVSISVAILAAIILTVVFYLKRTLKPIEGIVSSAKDIMMGKLDIDLEVKSQDEIGDLAQTFKDMSANLKIIINDVKYLLSQLSAGNFRVSSSHEKNYVGDYEEILSAVKEISASLSDTLSEINVASDQVNMGSDQVSSGAQALSQGSTEQAASVEELSATIADIAQQIKANADNAVHASKMSGEAGQGVMESNRQMQDLVKAMEDISNTSNEISKIIKTIDDIAFQTNILALNAAVEAARAGSAGKGFAVVADEVRNLAAKSADAAKNTTVLIENTLSAIANGSSMAQQTAKALQAVVEKASVVDETIQKIAQASENQATSVAQVTTGIDQISSVVQTNSATAEQSAAASEELSGQAQMLRGLVEKFQLLGGSSGYDAPQSFQEDSCESLYEEPASEPSVKSVSQDSRRYSFSGDKY